MQKQLHKFTGESLHMLLSEKCPNVEFFVVRIQENTDQKNLRI